MSKKILVTGATGNIATLVIPALIKKGLQVRAFVHNPQKAENLRKPGVDIFIGDLSNQQSINEAAIGMDTVLSITAGGFDAAAQTLAITNAAKRAGVKHLVRQSAFKSTEDAPTESGRVHHQSEQEVIASGIPYTILRPHFFMQSLLMSVPTIQQKGALYYGWGRGKMGLIDLRDVADCYVSILTGNGHEGKTYSPTGPASITLYDAAAIIAKGLGKPVSYIPITPEAAGEAMRAAGAGESAAQFFTEGAKSYSSGWGDHTTNDVETITGHKARSFQQFFDEVMSWGFKQPVKAKEEAFEMA